MRPPSFGFLYLVLALSAFVGYFAYLFATPWWEATGRERDVGEIRYLERIAAEGTAAQRETWLNDALRLANRHRLWTDAVRLFEACRSQDVALNPSVAPELVPDRVWALGFDAERWTRGASGALLIMQNAADRPMIVETEWHSSLAGKARVRSLGAAWQAIELEPGQPTSHAFEVAPSSTLSIEVGASRAMLGDRGPNTRALRIARVEVRP